MTFRFYSPRALEPWDWRNPDEKGIGNSETSHIEMALRLAKRGHEVVSYTNMPDETYENLQQVRRYGEVAWRDLVQADFSQSGVWVLYRCPEMIEQFTHRTRADQQVWLVVQDTYFVLTDPQAAIVDRVLCLCEAQAAKQREVSPNCADKVCVTSNGIRVDMIEEVERGMCEPLWADVTIRKPYRLHFSSSPDRGLPVLLEKIFPRAKEYVPELELHIYYGFDNIEKLLKQGDEAAQERARKFFGPWVERVKAHLHDPGVHWHGRIGQRDLTREWLKAGLWVFPSTYPESSCASVMEAQALGAIPITHPLWGLAENTKWGTLITGGDPYSDPLTQARYVAEIVRLARMDATGALDDYRRQMMADARRRFDWNVQVPRWEAWAGVPVSIGELTGATPCL